MPDARYHRPASSRAPAHSAVLALGAAAAALAACGGRESAGDPFARAAPQAFPQQIAPDLVVRAVRFGVLETAPDGRERFVIAQELRPECGTNFGWVAELETTRIAIRWQERLRPPVATDWGDVGEDPGVRVAPDGRSADAIGVAPVAGGSVARFYWALAPGDPPGEYRLELAIEGRAVAAHVFTVPAAVRERALLVRADAPGPAILAASGTARATAWR